MRCFLFTLSTVFFLIQDLHAQRSITINYTDTVGGFLPLQTDDDIRGLTYGSNTFGRQIRISRQQNIWFYDIGLNANNDFFITKKNGTTSAFVISNNGNVGIGTDNPGSFKLAVEGALGARSIQVTLASPWPDYVFNKRHQLSDLAGLESYIKHNRHLPGIPSAEEMQKSKQVDLGAMNVKLLEKVEELTMYVIELKKENDEIKKQLKGTSK